VSEGILCRMKKEGETDGFSERKLTCLRVIIMLLFTRPPCFLNSLFNIPAGLPTNYEYFMSNKLFVIRIRLCSLRISLRPLSGISKVH
jgi:hypothetical protein